MLFTVYYTTIKSPTCDVQDGREMLAEMKNKLIEKHKKHKIQ